MAVEIRHSGQVMTVGSVRDAVTVSSPSYSILVEKPLSAGSYEIRHGRYSVTVCSKHGSITVREPSYRVTALSGIIAGGTPFLGSYEVTPTAYEQVMATRAKTMADDVTIHSIPYHSTSNDSGGLTVSIAS